MAISRFLLASLNMDAVLAEPTIHQRRRELHRITKGLGLQDAYDTTLDRIRKQGGSKSRLGLEALMWISRCERPLRSQELCHALGVELGAEGFSIQNVPSMRTVLGYTLGLAIIDEQASTPRLLHFTLQEYLDQHPTLFATAHSMMAEICLTYLNCRSIRALPSGLYNVVKTSPFLEYATCFWASHAARGVTEPVKSLALRLLDGYERHASATIFSRRKIREGWREDIQRISGLHCIVFWGIAEIARTMLERKGRQVNERDSKSRTPLMWAVEYKKRGMVELLLEQEDIEPDTEIKDGRTVFSFAAELGNEDAVKLLLERGDVNPDSMDSNGRTPLSFAAGEGQEGVVKLLLQRGDINPNSADSDGRTPLSIVAEQLRGSDYHKSLFSDPPKYGVIVELLLERGDVDPNSPDRKGRTPLSFAAECGLGDLVKLLLQQGDINPDSADRDGRTPLSFAAERLRSPNPLPGDWDGRTPLSWFDSMLLGCPNHDRSQFSDPRGHSVIVKLLLERGDVDPNSPDRKGRTPLSFAAGCGLGDVVKLILQQRDIKPDSADRDGRTPLSFAAERLRSPDYYRSPYWDPSEHGVIVRLLLERRDVDPNSPDRKGRTPLSFAAECGLGDLVKLLLQRGDINPDSSDSDGRTPLSFAAERLRTPDYPRPLYLEPPEHDVIVKLLLERGDVDPDSPDSKGRTPLSFAAECGLGDLVKLLLQRADVNPDSADSDGRTPLSFAAQRLRSSDYRRCLILDPPEHGAIVELLLERRDVDPNSPDRNGRTPLSFAAECGLGDLVKLILQRADIKPDSADSDGRTPLSFAAERLRSPDLVVWDSLTSLSISAERLRSPDYHRSLFSDPPKHDVVVKLLLEWRDVDPNSPDRNGRTPLSFAAECGLGDLVKLFLQRGDISPDSADRDGRTPLSFAAEEGQEDVVKLLLQHGDINPNSIDCNGQKPLSYATRKEREGVVALLSDSRIPNRKPPQNRVPTPTYVTGGVTLGKRVTHSPTAIEPIALHTATYSLKRKGAGEKSTLDKRRKR